MNQRQVFEAIARKNGATDFSLKPDGRYTQQNLQSRWVYFALGWEHGSHQNEEITQALEGARDSLTGALIMTGPAAMILVARVAQSIDNIITEAAKKK